MKEHLKDYFDFTKKEKRGIFLLLAIILLLFIANLIPLNNQKNLNFSEIEKEVQNFEKTKINSNLNNNPKSIFTEKTRQKKKYSHTHKEKIIKPIELNTADTNQLIQLKGIGPVYSKRIIKYRELLGGYVNKKQLLEVYGIDNNLYNSIKKYIYIDSTQINKININTVEFKQLLRHPYIDYDLTKSIFKLRNQNGKFSDLSEIKNSKFISDSTYQKLIPYLKVN